MKKIIFTRGFPASGKTTWATNVCKNDSTFTNINRDDIRAQLGIDGIGNTKEESSVTAIQDSMIDAAMSMDKNIIISDTNVRVASIKRIIKRAWDHDYDFEIMDFKVDINELINRDNARRNAGKRSVGEDVIRMMNDKFPYKNWKSIDSIINDVANSMNNDSFAPVVQDKSLDKAVIFDIDGTLANPRDEEGNAMRNMYDGNVLVDRVNENVLKVLNLHREAGYKIIITTGRKYCYKADTLKWLSDNGIHFDKIFFRADGDMRNDAIVKYEIYMDNIHDNFYIETIFDDRNRVVDMWRKIFDRDTVCFQVNYGDF